MEIETTPNQELDAENIQRILEERARAIARPTATESPPEATTELVVLALGEERYGLDIQYAREVQPLNGLAPIPGTPPFWAGLVNLRGRLYPVLDLRTYLNLPANSDKPVNLEPLREADPSKSNHKKIVLVKAAGLEVAFLVDNVPGVQHVAQSTIGPPLTQPSGTGQAVIKGITSSSLVILDVELLLSDPRLVVQDNF